VKPDKTSYAVPPAESRWVQGELVRDLMRTQHAAQPVGMLLVPLLLVLLWEDIPQAGLLAWSFFTTAAAVARLAVLHLYRRDVLEAGADAHIAFLRSWWPVWPASSVAWGASVLLFFDRAPLQDQFICWLALAGLAMFTVATLSSHLQTMRLCLDALAASALASMVWHMGVHLHFAGPVQHWWMAAMLVVFWQVLRAAGLRQHLTLRKNYELQHRNNRLIESLTRQTQAALDAVESKNRFLASAAHDIRQPVHALGLYADWLGSEPEMVHEIAPKIVDATKAVNALFDSLFDVARLDSGKVRLTIEPVWVDKLLHDLELQYRPLAEAKGLVFRVHSVPGTVTTDPILLQRILGNLIANAVKYTERGGVLVAARLTKDGPRIEIWDTGVGIPPVYQREIFREFYKVPGHAGTEDGFGLGLYIVSRLCHILGHPLQLASRPGRGTVFRLLVRTTDQAQAMHRVRRMRGARVEVVGMPTEALAQP
jgi:signal transduction histidine kinase